MANERRTDARVEATAGIAPENPGEEDFPSAFRELKLSVIRPTFENVGNQLKARGHEIHIAEAPDGRISMHIVPAGVKKSIHPYDWFPTFSFFGAPIRKTIGAHGRNMRPNSDNGSGSRGDYTLAQINAEMVEHELMKFVGEIGNW